MLFIPVHFVPRGIVGLGGVLFSHQMAMVLVLFVYVHFISHGIVGLVVLFSVDKWRWGLDRLSMKGQAALSVIS